MSVNTENHLPAGSEQNVSPNPSAQPVREQKGPFVLQLIFALPCLVVAVTAAGMGRSYGVLFAVLYAAGAYLLFVGVSHLLYPLMRVEGETLVFYRTGLLPRLYRVPASALEAVELRPGIAVRSYTHWKRYETTLCLREERPIALGEKHLQEEEAVWLADFAPLPQGTPPADTRRPVVRLAKPAVLLLAALVIVGLALLLLALLHA